MTGINGNITIEIDGERFEISLANRENMDIIEIGEGLYQIPDDAIPHRIKVIDFDMVSRTCTVEMDGQRKQARLFRELDIMIEKMGLNAINSKKQNLIVAPMPGLVREIKVAIGEHVEKGYPLLILEAMKMENVISVPHEVVIKEINVKVGQAVERGLPLMEFS